MITRQDVTLLKKTFLTKEEFKKAAKAFATKKDLDALKYEVGDLRSEFGEMKETLD